MVLEKTSDDFVEFILLPSLMTTIAAEAPSLQIVCKSAVPRECEATMANGELDLVVGYLPDPPWSICWKYYGAV
jgi:DNA-binding transcriptional LysR family regulator